MSFYAWALVVAYAFAAATAQEKAPSADILFLNPSGHMIIQGSSPVYAMFRQDAAFKRKPLRLAIGVNNPEVSPDGKRIVYICSGVGLAQELCVIGTDGRNQARILTGKSGFSVLSASWSPDSIRLAVASASKAKTGVYIIRNDGSGEEKVSSAKAGEVAWSPDGQKIVYSAAADGSDVQTPTSIGGGVVATATGMWFERLGPKFRQVDLYLVDLKTKAETRLTRDTNTNMNPAWSPDGQWVAFASNRGGRYAIYFLEAKTGEVHAFVSAKQWHAINPSWSWDGKTLIFEIVETHEERINIFMIAGTEQIMTMGLDGKRKVLRRGSSPRFIPALDK